MAEQWIEDVARLAEEIGWRMMRATSPIQPDWVLALGHKSTSQWQIRCIDEHGYWVVHESHHWGRTPVGQAATIGPFSSFLEAATTWQLSQGGHDAD